MIASGLFNDYGCALPNLKTRNQGSEAAAAALEALRARLDAERATACVDERLTSPMSRECGTYERVKAREKH